jgi:hypothetical protein
MRRRSKGRKESESQKRESIRRGRNEGNGRNGGNEFLYLYNFVSGMRNSEMRSRELYICITNMHM